MKNKILKSTPFIIGVAFFALITSGCKYLDDLKCATVDLCEEEDALEYTPSEDHFIFVIPSGEIKLSPLVLEPSVRSRLINVYEGLVFADENFGIEPALAISWGLLNDTEWEFRLRENVKFHNGENVSTDDVLYSFDKAMHDNNSEVKGLLSNIEKVESNKDGYITIKTFEPDPVLLKKISNVYIFPKDSNPNDLPSGSGMYKIAKSENGTTHLENFKEYWKKETPYIQKASFYSENNRRKVVTDGDCADLSGISNSVCGVIADIPESKIGKTHESLSEYRFSKLSSIYAVFNYNSKDFPDEELQKDLIKTIDIKSLSEEIGELTSPATQYFASGSFGHDPNIELIQNEEVRKGKYLLRDIQPEITIDYLEGNDILAEYLKVKWEPLGINVKINSVSSEELVSRSKSGKSDIYIASWQVANGDAGEFFNDVIHTPSSGQKFGQFNWSDYGNQELNKLIENASYEMAWEERLEMLRSISDKSLEYPMLGVPLLEGRSVYAANQDLEYIPRADGLINLSTLKPKQ